MNCLVTAGPTCEPLDQVRRLTNFSTGKLGSGLADFMVEKGHHVVLLRSQAATCNEKSKADQLHSFQTTADLERRLQALSETRVDAVFHAAAVSDFAFGRILSQLPGGDLVQISSGKISSRHGTLLAELLPTPKIIAKLRGWFPAALLVGWKFEVDGQRPEALLAGRHQIEESHTDACVVNGPAYGEGFGFVNKEESVAHLPDAPALFEKLARFVAGGG
jgi:phosphopantothenate---cysteine ligase (CTP)